jgi:O-antigen/teichoic acid export membrane protein
MYSILFKSWRSLLLLSDLRASGIKRLLSPGAWAIADQGFSALASLAINLVLIRLLTPDQYGAFAVSFSWFLLLSGLHNSLLLEPLLVFGAGRYKGAVSAYLGTLAYGHWPLSMVLCSLLLLVAAAAWLLGSPVLGFAFAGAALSAPGLLLLQLARRSCFLHGDLRPAAAGGAIYLLLSLTGAFALSQFNLLSPISAYLLMGLTGFVVGSCILDWQGVPFTGASRLLALRSVALEHWEYGRWVIASTLAAWIPGNLYFLVLPIMLDLEAAGTMAALMLFLRPLMTVVQPLALMMVPGLVRIQHARSNVLHRITVVATLFLIGATCYWGLLALVHRPLVEWVLGTRYGSSSFLLAMLGGVAPMMAAASVVASGLRAASRPDLEFQAHLFSAVAALAIGLPLVIVLKLPGAAIGLTMSYAVLASAMVFMLISGRSVLILKIKKQRS